MNVCLHSPVSTISASEFSGRWMTELYPYFVSECDTCFTAFYRSLFSGPSPGRCAFSNGPFCGAPWRVTSGSKAPEQDVRPVRSAPLFHKLGGGRRATVKWAWKRKAAGFRVLSDSGIQRGVLSKAENQELGSQESACTHTPWEVFRDCTENST